MTEDKRGRKDERDREDETGRQGERERENLIHQFHFHIYTYIGGIP